MAKLSGGCLCGDVRYTLSAAPQHAVYCHCSMCRKSSGAPYTGWAVFALTALKWTNAEPAEYKSSGAASRHHCRRCGGQITWRTSKRPEFVAIAIGSLDTPDAVKPERHVFWADRVPGLEMEDGLPRS
ncbi:MAG TPA: GFA family protein [bacterium]